MTFLEIVNRIKRQCGVQGSQLTSFANRPEEILRLSDWANEAWMDIQLMYADWTWMRSSFSFATVSGQAAYTPAQAGITSFGRWKPETMRTYVTATGTATELFLSIMDYEVWRNIYLFGTQRNVFLRPVDVAVMPSKSLAFGPIPTAGITVTGDYYVKATEMVAETDEPAMPSQFHMLIVYMAMMRYGEYEAASEVFQAGQRGARKLKSELMAGYMDEITVGSPLV